MNLKRNDQNVVLPLVTDDYNPNRKLGLRSVDMCLCKICSVARQNGLQYLHSYRKNNKKRGRRPSTKTDPDHVVKICSNCFEKIYRGSGHSAEQCKRASRRTKVANIQDLTSPTTLKRASLRVEKETATPLGRPRKIAKVKKNLLSALDCAGIQQDLALSGTQTKILLHDLRLASGSRKIVEEYTLKTIRERNHRLDEFFELKELVYKREDKETKESKNVEVPTVVCSDLPALIEKIMDVRGREENVDSILVKISIDGGGGFLKFCISIFDIDDPSPKTSSTLTKKKFLIVIALAPNISEDYVNVKRLWLNSGVDKLHRKYTIATDLKLCNVLLGMMSHSSCHPCCWCEITKEALHKKGKQRTIESLMNLFFDFFDSKSDKKDAKKFGNVIHPPMISDDISDKTPVIAVIPPPELHLLIGPVNKMYSELEAFWPACEEWLDLCNVKKEDYHGGTFAGNACRKLLKNVARLEALNIPEKYKKFVTTFNSFNNVVSACYGNKLDEDYLQKIKIFAEDYFRLGISITPKVHAVIYHIPEFCEMTGRGLGPWSEQTGESVHSDFNKMWKLFKVNKEDTKMYGDSLLRAVQMYNSQHL